MPRQPQRLGTAGQKNLLLPLGQRQNAGGLDSERIDRIEGSRQLPLAPVNQENVGQRCPLAGQSGEPPSNHFVDTLKVIDAVHRLDAIAFVARFERQPVDELHEAGDRFVASQVGNVNTLNHAGRLGQAEHLFEPSQPLFGVNQKDFRLDVLLKITPLMQPFKQLDLVPQPGRPLKLKGRGGVEHLLPHLLEQLLLSPFQEGFQPIDVLPVLRLGDPQVARRGALIN